MKALSIQQPWAWLIVNGYKDIENRDWPTKLRGRFAVHAGKKMDTAGYEYVKREFPDVPLPTQFKTGGVIGFAEVVDCVTASDSRWFSGVYGFALRNAAPCTPFPLRGQLGFFDVPDALLSDDPLVPDTPQSAVQSR